MCTVSDHIIAFINTQFFLLDLKEIFVSDAPMQVTGNLPLPLPLPCITCKLKENSHLGGEVG